MVCKACENRQATNGPRCSRCNAWYWRNGSERPDYVKTETGVGIIRCNACGEPLADHGPPPCPMFDGRSSMATNRRRA